MNFRHRSIVALIVLTSWASRPALSDDVLPATPTIPDTPGAQWMPAATSNFTVANRPVEGAIDCVVIHDIEGSAESAVGWFQNPQAHASAHYVVSSTTGEIWQMVRERDIAWHAGNWDINLRAVGIEHEGFAGRPGFYNPLEYEVSAKLVRDITNRYKIPRDRTHIISHAEVPNPKKPGSFGGANGHTDPGPYWDWNYFMTLVRNDARLVDFHYPAVIHPGEMLEAWATFTNMGDDAWPVNNAPRADVPATGGTPPRAVPVYLGTTDPINRTSAFFNYKGWTSPRLAGVAEAEVAPGAVGRFVWTLAGPRELGAISESFRLAKVPIAPEMPVGFGEVATATIRVEPWDITPAVSPVGGAAAPHAELPIGGLWDVYARRPAGDSGMGKQSYQVVASTGTKVVPADQPADAQGWIKLGRFRFDDRKKADVMRLPQEPLATPVAGEIRFVGPFPAL